MTVTREGAFYIKSIEDIMFIQRNLKSYFMDLKNLNTGNLSLGGSSFFCSFVFPGLIGRFREKYPNVVINLMEGNVGELREGLENETVDLVIETATDVGSNIERFFYNHEKIILAVPTRYQVNKRLQPYRLSYQDILTGRFADSETEEVPLYELREVPFITMKPGNDMLTYYKIGDPLATRPVSFAIKKGKYTTSAMREFMKMAGVEKKEEE